MLLLVAVQLSLPLARLGQDPLQFGAAGQRGRLVGLVAAQFGGRGDVVVGEQPQPGVAQVSLDDGGPAGDGRLAAERLEAALQFRGQVHQPGQVGLHRLELAQRLLLAAAVLQHPRRFLDQRPPGLRPGVKYLVQLALTDDHVHLAAQARVGQEFLDVEQPAVVAVDRVLALPGPEEQAADRHLGVFDGQRAVAVVDGEGDFGPAERRAGRGPREDHVLHLAAPQGLHPLLAHHPGEGVHHVGLARPVGTDDAGDTWLEAEGGGGGKGFEAAQGEGLQVHLPAPLPLWALATSVGPVSRKPCYPRATLLRHANCPHLTVRSRRSRGFAITPQVRGGARILRGLPAHRVQRPRITARTPGHR